MLIEMDSYREKNNLIICRYCGASLPPNSQYSQCPYCGKLHMNGVIQDMGTTEKFKNEYCTELSKVIVILEKESKLL